MRKSKLCLAIILIISICFIDKDTLYAADGDGVSVYHAHNESCGGTSTTTYQASDNGIAGTGGAQTVRSDTCACGARHDYYVFYSVCSCGAEWYAEGHACWNSPYGAYTGTCSNYQIVNSNTMHYHTSTTYECGYTTTSEVATLQIEFETSLPTQEMDLEAVVSNQTDIVNLTYEWSDASALKTLTVAENGTYTVVISGDNIADATASVTVSNIDLTKPTITSYVADTTEENVDVVTLTVEATDDMGLANEPYSWDGGSSWGTENSKAVYSNGIHKVFVKDLAGNIAEAEYEVTNIFVPKPPADTTPPVILNLYPDRTDITSQVILTVEVGETNVLISWDGGNTWGTSTTTTATANALHTVLVRDAAGNVSSKSYEVTNIYVTAPEQEETEEKTEEVVIPEEVEEEPITEESIEPPKDTVVTEEEPEIMVETIEVQDTEIKGSIGIFDVVKVAAPVSSGGFFFFFGLWFLNKNVSVYSQSGISEKRLGRVRAKKTDKGYEIKVPATMLRKAGSNQYRIKVSKKLSKDAEGMYCKVMLGGKEVESRLTREMYVEG